MNNHLGLGLYSFFSSSSGRYMYTMNILNKTEHSIIDNQCTQ